MIPTTTLFMLMSVDGKISSGDIDKFDFDKDLPHVPYVAHGLNQYYDLEKETDHWSFNTGRVMAKMGWNDRIVNDKLDGVSFMIYDNQWLKYEGVANLASALDNLVIVTSEGQHPADLCGLSNVKIVKVPIQNLRVAFAFLYEQMGCTKITLQSGGRMNNILFRQGLVNYVNLVVAPLIVGGRLVSTLVDGDAITKIDELLPMELTGVQVLHDSYLNLHYKVLNGVV